jgi:hypothetical protein
VLISKDFLENDSKVYYKAVITDFGSAIAIGHADSKVKRHPRICYQYASPEVTIFK